MISIFDSFKSEKIELKNRVCMAPMTRKKSNKGIFSAEAVDYYAARAAAQVALILTESIAVNHVCADDDNRIPRLDSKINVDNWRPVVDQVHFWGGKIIPQLTHVGMDRNKTTAAYPDALSFSPSGENYVGRDTTIPMSKKDIDNVIAAFAHSAKLAMQAGFDGIEIQAAHGFLLDQFLWEKTNKRTDRYGGSLANRANFVKEIVIAVREVIGADKPIIVRISQWKQLDYAAKIVDTPAELEVLLAKLVLAGVDIFDCSTRRFWFPEFPGSELNLAGWVKKITAKPTITVGGIGLTGMETPAIQSDSSLYLPNSVVEIENRLSREEFDLIAVGRALLNDPGWLEKQKPSVDFDVVTT